MTTIPYFTRPVPEQTLQERVYESLDNAMDNAPEWLRGASTIEIALDMCEYDASFENDEPDDLVPHIQTWWQKL